MRAARVWISVEKIMKKRKRDRVMEKAVEASVWIVGEERMEERRGIE